MNDFILFINSGSDADIAKTVYTEHAHNIKIRIHDLDKIANMFPKSKLIIDLAFDGYPEDRLKKSELKKLDENAKQDESSWSKFFKANFKLHETFSDVNFLNSPKKETVHSYIFQVLDYIKSYQPHGIVIPQLNYTSSEFRKLNKLMAEASADWKSKNQYSGHFILPVIFTSKTSIITGTERTKSMTLIEKNYTLSSANSIWIVDSSLQDQAGTSDFEKNRFPAMIDLHTRINSKLSPSMHIAGPYWGLNILLWTRRLITNPAFSLGTGFQHYSPSGRANTPTPRMAIPPLLRWAKSTSALAQWLESSASELRGNPEENEFTNLLKVHNKLNLTKKHKEQVAHFYLNWYLRYHVLQPQSRPLALYQDLSKSYVLGSKLRDISSEETTTRKPEIVAKQLMLNCL